MRIQNREVRSQKSELRGAGGRTSGILDSGFSLLASRKRLAFTLIELLVVIAVIALLAALIMLALRGTRGKARDAVRKNEIAQLGQFMRLGCFVPEESEGGETKDYGIEYDVAELLEELRRKYPALSQLKTVPKDPRIGTEEVTYYFYVISQNGQDCALYANLENPNEPITLSAIDNPAPGGGKGVFEANTGWNNSNRYFQDSN